MWEQIVDLAHDEIVAYLGMMLILSAFLTSLSLIFALIFFNSLNLLKAAVFKLHLKKNFTSELGRILVEISLPSIQQFLCFFEKFN